MRIGSGSNGTAGGNITILADGSIQLYGTQRSAAIRTLDSVMLEAASINQAGNGFILADTLTTTTSGVTNLAGPNEIAKFNGTSGGALTLVDGGVLQVTGITTTNDAITLTTDSLTNIGTITNTGGAPGAANMTFNADAFNLAGGTINAGSAAVVLRPRTGTNSFGIEAAGQTTLTNADIASINTNDFVVFGSGIGTLHRQHDHRPGRAGEWRRQALGVLQVSHRGRHDYDWGPRRHDHRRRNRERGRGRGQRRILSNGGTVAGTRSSSGQARASARPGRA